MLPHIDCNDKQAPNINNNTSNMLTASTEHVYRKLGKLQLTIGALQLFVTPPAPILADGWPHLLRETSFLVPPVTTCHYH